MMMPAPVAAEMTPLYKLATSARPFRKPELSEPAPAVAAAAAPAAAAPTAKPGVRGPAPEVEGPAAEHRGEEGKELENVLLALLMDYQNDTFAQAGALEQPCHAGVCATGMNTESVCYWRLNGMQSSGGGTCANLHDGCRKLLLKEYPILVQQARLFCLACPCFPSKFGPENVVLQLGPQVPGFPVSAFSAHHI